MVWKHLIENLQETDEGSNLKEQLLHLQMELELFP